MAFFSFIYISFFFFSLFFSANSLVEAEANPNFSFQFESFEKDPNSPPQISLHGDAKISNSTVISSNGAIMYKKPIRFLGTNPGFSTDFSFSVSEPNGEQAVAFLMGHGDLSGGFLVVEFGSRLRIDALGEVSIKSSNLSAFGLVPSSGQKLHSWIDYNGFQKRLEVSLGTSGASRPSGSLISCRIDLSNVSSREAVVIGISSSSQNSTQFSGVYSWRFAVKHRAPYRMHSEPLDPSSLVVRSDEYHSSHSIKDYYSWRNIASLVVGAVFGALVVSVVYIMRSSSVVKRHPIAPVEYQVGIGYEKIGFDGSKVVCDCNAK